RHLPHTRRLFPFVRLPRPRLDCQRCYLGSTPSIRPAVAPYLTRARVFWRIQCGDARGLRCCIRRASQTPESSRRSGSVRVVSGYGRILHQTARAPNDQVSVSSVLRRVAGRLVRQCLNPSALGIAAKRSSNSLAPMKNFNHLAICDLKIP
ncbi:unnamed protein product, partial [Rhizoctonia solani]